SLAARSFAQAREDVCVDLTPETQVLDLGVLIDERLLPGDPVKRRRQSRRGERAAEIDLPPQPLVVSDRHRVFNGPHTAGLYQSRSRRIAPIASRHSRPAAGPRSINQ